MAAAVGGGVDGFGTYPLPQCEYLGHGYSSYSCVFSYRQANNTDMYALWAA